MAAAAPDSPTNESSYTYWVRRRTEQAAPDPVPRKLSSNEIAQAPQPTVLGSAWNQAGTWEEKCVTKWATNRIEELLLTLEPLQLKEGHAQVTEVSGCVGEASLVTVRNKKRHGFCYEITLKFKGDWRDSKGLEGTLKVPEASYNDLDDIELEVNLSSTSIIVDSEKAVYLDAVRSFLPAIRERLLVFEDELKAR